MNIAVSACLVTGLAVAAYAVVQLHRIKAIHVAGLVAPGHSDQSRPLPHTTTDSGPPMTVLIVGSDTRAGLDEPGDSRFGSSAEVQGARSDTIILARVVPATHQIGLLSIPRDLYVDIPGMGEQKINAAFNNGPDLLVRVLGQQLGVEVNHYIDVDFDTFRQVSDAVGGVGVYFPTPARDLFSGLVVPGAGCTSLVGDQALAYVRSREYQYYEDGEWHQEAQSDLARIQRQQTFIRTLIKKAETTGLDDPLQLNDVISGVTKNLTVDSGLSVSGMIALVKDLASVDATAIPGQTLATSEETLEDGEDVLLPEPSEDRAQLAQFLALGTQAGPGTSPSTAPSAADTTTTAAPPPTVAPSSVAVEVANGTRVAGQATATSRSLRAAGFDVTDVTDAPSANLGPTQVLYGADASEAAATVAAYVQGPVALVASRSLGSSSVEVVTGSGFAGISATPGAGSPTAAPSTTTATTAPASTTTSTTYVLPGAPQGQPMPACG